MSRFFVAAFAAVGLVTGAAQAASITWSLPTTIAADTDVSTVGTLAYAYNFNQGSTAQTINTVTFVGYDSGFVGAPAFTSNSDISLFAPSHFLLSFNVFGSGNPPFTGLSSAYQGLVSTAIFSGDGAPTATLTLNGLIVGEPYLVQLWTNDSRFGGRSQTYTAGTTSAPALSNVLGVDGGLGTYVIGTFVADGTSQAIDIAANVSVQLNALQLRVIPEPAALSLLGLGGLAMLRRRRLA